MSGKEYLKNYERMNEQRGAALVASDSSLKRFVPRTEISHEALAELCREREEAINVLRELVQKARDFLSENAEVSHGDSEKRS